MPKKEVDMKDFDGLMDEIWERHRMKVQPAPLTLVEKIRQSAMKIPKIPRI